MNMQKKRIIAVMVGMMAIGPLGAAELVVRTDYDQPAKWERQLFLGRDFHPMLRGVYWAEPGREDTAPEGFSVYRECALRIDGQRPKGVTDLVPPKGTGANGGAKEGYAELLPESERRKEPYRLYDFFSNGQKSSARADYLYGTNWNRRAFLLSLDGERPAFRLNRTYPFADREDYAQWKAAHPNMFGTYAMMEFDSDQGYYFINVAKNKDVAALARLQEAFPFTFYDYAFDPYLFDNWAKEAHRRCTEYCFGEKDLWGFTSGTPGMVMLYAELGFKGVCYEATTQGADVNWRVAGAYLRGAARQFGMDYGWYTASYMDGYDRVAKKRAGGENSFIGSQGAYKSFGPNRGASFEITDRNNVYGWLIGSRFVEVENWYPYHMEGDGVKNAKPSRAARHFQRLYDLSKTVDRGQVYVPIALLFPIHEGTGGSGGQPNFSGFEQSAPLITLTGGWWKKTCCREEGFEGGFYNTEYPDFFDIVCPDAKDGAADAVYEALKPYKAACLFGRYRRNFGKDFGFDPAGLKHYVEEGGTLVLSSDYLKEGRIPSDLAGVAFDGREVFAAAATFTDDRGAETAFGSPYILEKGAATTARVFWKDANGNPVAYLNKVGRGRVLTIAVDAMLPHGLNRQWGILEPAKYTSELLKMRVGETGLGLHKVLFRRLRDETMPVTVTGDVQWGVNKVKSKEGKGKSEEGWLIWFYNNKGITNFLNEEPVIDRAADAKVTFAFKSGFKPSKLTEVVASAAVNPTVKQSGNQTIPEFSLTVPAGLWRAIVVE